MTAAKEKAKKLGSLLIVEDNTFMSELLAEKIANRGFTVSIARTGSEALEAYKKDDIDIVLFDLPLSGDMDGISCIQTIRKDKDTKTLPLVGLFSIHDQAGMDAGMKAGLNTYLIKPEASTDDIADKIQLVLESREVFVPQPSNPEVHEAAKESPVAKDDGVGSLKIRIPEQRGGDASIGQSMQDLEKEIKAILGNSESEISIIDLVDRLIEYAFVARSSDIHLEPTEAQLFARLRIDGLLHDTFTFPKALHSGIITRIKVLAGMRTDEHQAAQDGRFKMNMRNGGRKFDMRVSIVPTYFGENAVLRLLAEQTQISTLDDLALTALDKQKIRNAAKRPHGMILATGPTGSGKSTTLYTILREINKREVSIITVEDPVEYSLEGIDQIQVNNRSGLTFANGLRSILRQDPNVIMVGEIRDEETASIAVNAALTGHKLLSTLHTNDAATTLPRLLDMGVEPFLVASTINVAIGQRLVRVLCQTCKAKKTLTEAEFKSLAQTIPPEILGDDKDFYEAKGCKVCNNTGYYDRMGIYEILEVNDFIRDAIIRRVDAGEIKKIAVKNGMVTLLEDGVRKARAGYTTIEEILRVVHD